MKTLSLLVVGICLSIPSSFAMTPPSQVEGMWEGYVEDAGMDCDIAFYRMREFLLVDDDNDCFYFFKDFGREKYEIRGTEIYNDDARIGTITNKMISFQISNAEVSWEAYFSINPDGTLKVYEKKIDLLTSNVRVREGDFVQEF